MVILLLALFIIPYIGMQTGHDFDIVGRIITEPTRALIRFVLAITGQRD